MIEKLDLTIDNQEIKELEMRAFNLDSDSYDKMATYKTVTPKELGHMIEVTPYPHAKESFMKILSEYERINHDQLKMLVTELGHTIFVMTGTEKIKSRKVNVYYS